MKLQLNTFLCHGKLVIVKHLVFNPLLFTLVQMKCPKRRNMNGHYEVDLIYGLFPTTWSLHGLTLNDGKSTVY